MCAVGEFGIWTRFSSESKAYDVCISDSIASDRRIKAFINVTRSSAYRLILSELPGNDSSEIGHVWSARLGFIVATIAPRTRDQSSCIFQVAFTLDGDAFDARHRPEPDFLSSNELS